MTKSRIGRVTEETAPESESEAPRHSLFARRQALVAIGGVPDVPLFEDWMLSRRLRRIGRMRMAAATPTTSARRLERWGRVRSTVTWAGLSVLFLAGVAPDCLARLYPNVR